MMDATRPSIRETLNIDVLQNRSEARDAEARDDKIDRYGDIDTFKARTLLGSNNRVEGQDSSVLSHLSFFLR